MAMVGCVVDGAGAVRDVAAEESGRGRAVVLDGVDLRSEDPSVVGMIGVIVAEGTAGSSTVLDETMEVPSGAEATAAMAMDDAAGVAPNDKVPEA
jgi:hypothetical protein